MVSSGQEFFRSLFAWQEQGCEPRLPQWQTPGLVQPGHCCSWPSSLPDLSTTQWSARLLIRGGLIGQFALVTAKQSSPEGSFPGREGSSVLPCASLFPLAIVPCFALALGSFHPAMSQFNVIPESYLWFFFLFCLIALFHRVSASKQGFALSKSQQKAAAAASRQEERLWRRGHPFWQHSWYLLIMSCGAILGQSSN